jgi:hypothetical protein
MLVWPRVIHADEKVVPGDDVNAFGFESLIQRF